MTEDVDTLRLPSTVRTGRTMTICLDTEMRTAHNAIPGRTKVVTLEQLQRMSAEGYTRTKASWTLQVPESTFRAFLIRNGLDHLFTIRCRQNARQPPGTDNKTFSNERSKENHHMTNGNEGASE